MTIAENQHLGKKEWTCKDYIQNGLVLLADGVENAGFGKHEDFGNVVNLVSGQKFTQLNVDADNMIYAPVNANINSGTLYNQVASAVKAGTFCFEYVEGIANQMPAFSPNYSNGGWNYCTGQVAAENIAFRIGQVTKSVNQKNEDKLYSNSMSANFLTAEARGGDFRFYWTEADLMKWPTEPVGYPNPWGLYFLTNSKQKTIRFYNRYLTQEETDYNYYVDKKRFGI